MPIDNEFSALGEKRLRESRRRANDQADDQTSVADATPPARPPSPAEDDVAAKQILQDNKFRNMLQFYVGKKKLS